MLYLYDNAICEDLQKSFNTTGKNAPVVKVFSPEHVLELVAQIKEDKISFPVIALERIEPVKIDQSRANFTRLHKGVVSVFDNEKNNIYYEKVVPVKLAYRLTALTTNQVDSDELTRELIFKYTNMYYLPIKLPYEANRHIRFGVRIDPDMDISTQSSSSQYISEGKLYDTSMQLECEGCVLVSYTPVKLKRYTGSDIESM